MKVRMHAGARTLRRGRAGALAALAGWMTLGACALSADVVGLPFPEGGSVLFLFDDSARGVSGLPVILGNDSLVSVPLDAPERASVQALDYECALTTLGLEDNRLVALGAQGLPLPRPARMRTLTPDGWQPSTWTPRHAELRFPSVSPCPSFDLQLLELQGAEPQDWPHLVVPTARGGWLISTGSGLFFEVSPRDVASGAPVDALQIDSSIPNGGGFLRDDGELWLVGQLGQVARGREPSELAVDDTVSSTTALDIGDRSRLSVHVSGSSESLEIFVATERGDFYRYGEGRWHTLLERESVSEGPYFGVVRVGPGEAFVLLPQGDDGNEPNLFHYQRGSRPELEKIYAPMRSNDVLTIAFIPGAGLTIGTRTGAILKYVDKVWTPVANAKSEGHLIYLLAPTEKRGEFIFGGNSGLLLQGGPVGSGCPEIPTAQVSRLYVLVANGNRFAATGKDLRSASGSPLAAILTRRENAGFEACTHRDE
ncbi:MAG: hypothetical protein HYV07_23080 [Deltaproteobacteria bacterium]|nr:hypothetical protein [Deltaproteobacteria bacterium]